MIYQGMWFPLTPGHRALVLLQHVEDLGAGVPGDLEEVHAVVHLQGRPIVVPHIYICVCIYIYI